METYEIHKSIKLSYKHKILGLQILLAKSIIIEASTSKIQLLIHIQKRLVNYLIIL